ncbi:hypothetical protein [Pedococcus sp. 5OH_020]|uniref:hypothetical protein n=1 Tax=Pedococcus sp. 5OH_020 TaxID=2989814 RepID=UPI0022EA0C44|nr:hypothetical protein [Pedococcus sp. 5OH_020]
MRRRAPKPDPQRDPPEKLLRYDARDWPEAACHPECAFWEAATEWARQHPDDADYDIVGGGPDTPWHPELV